MISQPLVRTKHAPAAAEAAAERAPRRPALSAAALRLVCIVLLLAFWELAPRLGWVPEVMLAPLSSTLVAGFDNGPMFAMNLASTVAEMAAALAIVFVVGGACGLLLGSVAALRDTLLPLASSLYAVPLVILYPLLTAWIGIGMESKIVFGAVYGFFPMLLATAAGVRTVDRQLLVAARSMGARRMQLVRHVMLPAAVPSVLSGMRLGSAMTAIGVVVAEMMAATSGIGFVITQNRTLFNTPNVYFGVLLVLVLAVALDQLVNFLQRIASRRYPQPENKS
ncbi:MULTISPECIES: ABC transporter permease [unclassified Caballeronia]|uniref:ABC transporter permease n=1 Tax=unclassified Caballeronia TaxID=2646786 RepID=UPI00285FB47C|nr:MULTISPECIES: ABC transporter permease [unclassified Caballeronia]MDR5817140.1 ABC transporter permease [Caballeronia sp. LZ033]MDR5824048.1 ABC transporter permease [Caballeronia sp. LZ043]MDR5881943.1 ABC transporter permease [Caballeronia sp. LZ032]